MKEQVRSGRSPQRGAGSADAAALSTEDGADGVDDVVVVGRGPVARAVAAGWPGVVRTIDELPVHGARLTLVGASVVVLVGHSGEQEVVGTRGQWDRQADVVAHTQRTLAAARAVGVRHLVAISSAAVHGAWPDRAEIHDADPVAAVDEASRDGLVGDLLAMEAVLERGTRRARPLITILRPAALAGPGVDTFVTRHFEAPRLLTVRGATREWQFVHVEDLASAVRFAVEHQLTGTLTVGAADVLTPEQVERAAGMRRIELAATTAFGTAERLHRVGVLPSPAAELAFVVYPWTVASDGLRAAGWAPLWTSATCLDVLLEGVQGRLAVAGRRLGTRDAAAIGAAGAAVAFLGTAAVWRQARARRGR